MSDERKTPIWLTIVNSIIIVLGIYGGAYLGLALAQDWLPPMRIPRLHVAIFCTVPVGAVAGGIAAILLTKRLVTLRKPPSH